MGWTRKVGRAVLRRECGNIYQRCYSIRAASGGLRCNRAAHAVAYQQGRLRILWHLVTDPRRAGIECAPRGGG